jgi:predicted HAD superfamily Cof-like phosphohydrolase
MKHDLIEATRKFNLAAGRSEDHFNTRAVALHLGLQLEEMAETLSAVTNHPRMTEASKLSLWRVTELASLMQGIGQELKDGMHDASVAKADKHELLDGCIDVIVVSIGNIMSQGAQMLDAMSEVAGANLAKIGPNGVCIKNSAGKIQKPEGWKAPNLHPFIAAEQSA